MWLESLLDVEKRPDLPYERLGLDPVRRLLACLGQPDRGLRVLHVAGSKGKGSTALFAEALLVACGERVGTFTSPHLERWTERFRVDGREVDSDRLAAAVARLRPHVERLRAEDPAGAPTFFDATTAAALLVFEDCGLERAILEVGLGGRLDSTNAVMPEVTCITSIELEHTDRLGTSHAEIAREKAGILKAGVPAVLGRLPGAALEVVLERAGELGAPVYQLDRDFGFELRGVGLDGLELRIADGPLAIETRIPVLGAHQALNAALAVACVRRSGVSDQRLAAEAPGCLARARLPGRIELLGSRPWRIVDASHTRESARALAEALALVPRRRSHLVLSISVGKDTGAILDLLLPQASQLTLTRAEPTRSLAPEAIAEAVRGRAPQLPVRVVPNPHLAVRAARDGLGPDDLLCATGSVYLAGIARSVLREEGAAPPIDAPGRRQRNARAGTPH